MTDEKDDGGPAFPVQDLSKWQCAGMTLRDYFAAQALAGLNFPLSSMHDAPQGYARFAEHTYKMADAMLKARES